MRKASKRDHDVKVNSGINQNPRAPIWLPLRDALDAGGISTDRQSDLVRDPLRWIGQSPLAGIMQCPTHEQVGRIVETIQA